MMYKYIFFDLDNTILDFNKAEREALSKTFIDFGLEPKEEILKAYHEINMHYWQRLEDSKLSREEILVFRFMDLFEKFGIEESYNLCSKKYEEYLACSECHFIDGAEELLNKLKSHYYLYIVTNGSKRIQDLRITNSGVRKYFNDIFISQEIGSDKPNKKFFDYCFSKIPDFNKKQAIIIGDSLSSDIKGGYDAGITTVWFNLSGNKNNVNIYPDFEIKNLLEFENILQ